MLCISSWNFEVENRATSPPSHQTFTVESTDRRKNFRLPTIKPYLLMVHGSQYTNADGFEKLAKVFQNVS